MKINCIVLLYNDAYHKKLTKDFTCFVYTIMKSNNCLAKQPKESIGKHVYLERTLNLTKARLGVVSISGGALTCRIFHQRVLSIMVFGAKIWTLKRQCNNNRSHREPCNELGISFRDRVRSSEIWKEADV